MWQLLPPTALLLLVSADAQTDPLKAVVSLDPPWARVLEKDSVTLKCQGAHPPEGDVTQWYHNDSLIPNQASSYFIREVRAKDSGEYRCQTQLSTRSDPVQLDVHTGWLVLQALRWVFQEGEPIRLRCHSWKNNPVQKVSYLQDGKVKKFFHQNTDFVIPAAARSHSGTYYCRGLIGSKNMSSETVDLLVQGPASPSVVSSVLLPWHQVAFCLLMGLLFAVDTGLYFSMQRDFQSSQGHQDYALSWSQNSQSK
ncbi:low affinity immunoglobulin gamma Fc region receptor III-B isoform X2 [Tupaia chinensis]|uniref:low affinity immunoglobulin gamma Fc region receptor III-B isoform X2 n=1 Tax=Tupaia chinensis TaxID=246437 RepID=UPI0003C9214E|nr:low affinity immunoglobulin gamma Fc region receptor III-B isoform X2 [Tupaia chinensis]